MQQCPFKPQQNKSCENTAFKHSLTWNSRIVFSWQVASHITHCRQRRYSTEEFKSVFPTDLRAVLQNKGGSDATGPSPVICRPVQNKSRQQKSELNSMNYHETGCVAFSFCVINIYGFVITSQLRPTSRCGLYKEQLSFWELRQSSRAQTGIVHYCQLQLCVMHKRRDTCRRRKEKQGCIKVQTEPPTSTNVAFVFSRRWSTLDFP